MVKGNTAVGKEEPPEHQQSFPLTAQRMNLQDRFASGTGYRTEGVLGNAGTHGMSSSAGTSLLMSNDPSMQQRHAAAIDAVALMRRHQEEQTFMATRLLALRQQQEQAALRNSVGAAAAATANSRLGIISPLVGSSNTAASRAGLEVSALLQQQLSRQQQDLDRLRSQVGLFSHALNRDAVSTSSLGLSQQCQFQESMLDIAPAASADTPLVRPSKASTVQHDAIAAYYDGSSLPVPECEEGEEDTDNDEETSRKSKGGIIEPFPTKLFRIIEDAEKDGRDDIISFFSHGRAFAIHKPRVFVSQLMPDYFSTSRMSSFQRQLNLYGFRRITDGRDKGGYFHEFFLKGRKGLCKKIKRKKLSKALITETTPSMDQRGSIFPTNRFTQFSTGNNNSMTNYTDAANLFQLQLLAAAQSGGLGGTTGNAGFAGATSMGGFSGLGSFGGNMGDTGRFAAQQLFTNAGFGGGAHSTMAGIQSLPNFASLLQEKQFMEHKQLLAHLQQLEQLQKISSPPLPPRGPSSFEGRHSL